MADDATTRTHAEGDTVEVPVVEDFTAPENYAPLDEDGDGVADQVFVGDINGDGIPERLPVVKRWTAKDGSERALLDHEIKPPPPPEPRDYREDAVGAILRAAAVGAQARYTAWQSFRRNAGLYLVIFIAGIISGITVNRALTSEEAAVPAPPAVVPASTNDALPRVVQDWLETPSTRARTRESERERFRRAWEAHTGTAWEDRP